jgi:hypothetical protein
MKKSREEIINSMCLTWDHSYLAPRQEIFPGHVFGLTDEQKQNLWNRMAQLFDNDIAPYMRFKKQKDRDLNKEHGYARIGYDAMRRGK